MFHREEYEVSEIRFRSVSERRLADQILSREGKWDPAQQSFLTREKQLQERTKLFQSLHSMIRYQPASAYEAQGRDVEFVYPNCPRELLRRHQVKNSQLTMEDPTPDNIEYRREIAERNKVLREKSDSTTASPIFTGKEKEELLAEMEQSLIEAAQQQIGSRASCKQEQHVTRALSTAAFGLVDVSDHSSSAVQQRLPTPLPRLRDESRSHSSLLRQLKMTKKQAEAHRQENSTAKCLLNMQASAELKRAITRMFADPKNAEAISAEEQQKRDAAYLGERSRTQKYQNDLMKDEREMMERELASIGKQ